MKSKKKLAWVLMLPLLFVVGLLWTPLRARVFSSGPSPETRGYGVAQEQGCFHCHGSWGRGGVANPGARKIPALVDYAFLMDVRSQTELEAWILDGAPKRIREKDDYQKARDERAVSMPAYRGRLSQGELADLLAWYHALAGTVRPVDEQARKGFEVAAAKGCFSCHGHGGRFDLPNPGSLVGRIPAWHGDDFAELARDEEEIRQWILDGNSQRLAAHPIAKRFIKRQLIQMPAYRDLITDEELAAILAYIQWLRNPSALGHEPNFTDPGGAEDTSEFY